MEKAQNQLCSFPCKTTSSMLCQQNMHRGNSLVQVIKSLLPMQETRFDPWVRKIPWRRKWQPTPVFLPGESHGQRSLAGCSPQGHRESGSTEHTHQACTVLISTDVHLIDGGEESQKSDVPQFLSLIITSCVSNQNSDFQGSAFAW